MTHNTQRRLYLTESYSVARSSGSSTQILEEAAERSLVWLERSLRVLGTVCRLCERCNRNRK